MFPVFVKFFWSTPIGFIFGYFAIRWTLKCEGTTIASQESQGPMLMSPQFSRPQKVRWIYK